MHFKKKKKSNVHAVACGPAFTFLDPILLRAFSQVDTCHIQRKTHSKENNVERIGIIF